MMNNHSRFTVTLSCGVGDIIRKEVVILPTLPEKVQDIHNGSLLAQDIKPEEKKNVSATSDVKHYKVGLT